MPATIAAPNPRVIRWAAERSGRSHESFKNEWPRFDEWLTGERAPTLKQAAKFAKKVHVPFADLYGEDVPDMGLRLPDFRGADLRGSEPSPELYDVVKEMSWRQSWMHDYFEDEGYEPVPFVGSVGPGASVADVVASIREHIGLSPDWASGTSDAGSAFRKMRNAAEAVRVSVAVSGVVGDNTHRPLDVSEFRGLVFSDDIAPLIFVNGADADVARSFTLAHELAHLALGSTGVVSPSDGRSVGEGVERLCEEVAAEIMVPRGLLLERWRSGADSYDEVRRLSRRFRASFPAVAIQALRLGLVGGDELDDLLDRHSSMVEGMRAKKGSGGDYYRTKGAKLGRVFSDSIVIAVKSGQISYTKALQLTGTNPKTFSGLFDGVM